MRVTVVSATDDAGVTGLKDKTLTFEVFRSNREGDFRGHFQSLTTETSVNENLPLLLVADALLLGAANHNPHNRECRAGFGSRLQSRLGCHDG
jgi:hypothetical protein